MTEKKVHKPRLGAAMVAVHLATGYAIIGALWEIIKNGADACFKKMLQLDADEAYQPKVDVYLVEGHVAAPSRRSKAKTLLIVDNGTGITDPDMEKFLTVGPDEENPERTGIYGRKKIGRYAALGLLRDKQTGFWIVSRKERKKPLRQLHIRVNGEVEESEICDDNAMLHGLKPEGTFTMVIIPDVTPKVYGKEAMNNLKQELRLRMPRLRPDDDGTKSFQLFVNRKEMKPMPLPDKVVIKAAGPNGQIEGYFDLTGEGEVGGVEIWDPEANVPVASCMELVRHIPSPLHRPELTGILYIPGIEQHQNVARTGLGPDFLDSPEWSEITVVLIEKFVRKLEDLLGDRGRLKEDFLTSVFKNFVDVCYFKWGADPSLEEPIDIDGPEDFPGDIEEARKGKFPRKRPNKGKRKPPRNTGTHDRGKGGGPKSPGAIDPPYHEEVDVVDRKPRSLPFPYKGKMYYISYAQLGNEYEFARIDGPRVLINTKSPMITTFLKKSPAAALLYFVNAVIGVIEQTLDLVDNSYTHKFVPAVSQGVIEFYAAQAELRKDQRKK